MALAKMPIFHVQAIIGRDKPVHISTVHVRLRQGWSEDLDPDNPFVGPQQYAVNLQTGPLWFPPGSLLATREVGERLKNVSTVELVPATIGFAYDWEVCPGDGLERHFKKAFRHGSRATDIAVEEFLRSKNAQAAPPSLVEVNPVSDLQLRAGYSDLQEIRVGMNDECTPGRAYLSRTMVEEHGVVRSIGQLFALRAFEIVRPYIDNLYFVVTEL